MPLIIAIFIPTVLAVLVLNARTRSLGREIVASEPPFVRNQRFASRWLNIALDVIGVGLFVLVVAFAINLIFGINEAVFDATFVALIVCLAVRYAFNAACNAFAELTDSPVKPSEPATA